MRLHGITASAKKVSDLKMGQHSRRPLEKGSLECSSLVE